MSAIYVYNIILYIPTPLYIIYYLPPLCYTVYQDYNYHHYTMILLLVPTYNGSYSSVYHATY